MHKIALALLALAGVSQGQVAHMMRFACSQLTVERLDPLVNPGQIGTPHTHQIVSVSFSNRIPLHVLIYCSGGNSFRPDMEPVKYDLPTQSTCTSCTFSEVMTYRYPYRSLHA